MVAKSKYKKAGCVNHVLLVDHDHKTGKVRSLLCHKCNVALGHNNEDINFMKKLIKYLEESENARG